MFERQSLTLVLKHIWFILGARIHLFSTKKSQGIKGLSPILSTRSEWVKGNSITEKQIPIIKGTVESFEEKWKKNYSEKAFI